MTKKSNEVLVQRMQHFREEQKITQKQMADYLGLSSSYISAMERGLHTPNALTLIGYASKLQISIDDLVGQKNTIKPELLTAIKQLSDKQQDQLVQIINVLNRR